MPTGSQGSAGSTSLTAETGDRSELVLPGKIAGSFGVASMLGSSVAGPTAALWVTDVLHAAYDARDRDERSLDDLRLARSILATAWHRADDRRPTDRDLIGFHPVRHAVEVGVGRGLDPYALPDGVPVGVHGHGRAGDDRESRSHQADARAQEIP